MKPVVLANPTHLQGRLVRRYKRFLADVELGGSGGEVLTVHCPNPGSMLGTQKPGSAVRLSTSDNPNRKLRHTLEMIRVGRVWVGLHAARANAFASRLIHAGAFPWLRGYAEIQPEVKVGDGSRLDFRLAANPGDPRPCFVEVKSVTLAAGSTARFPDAVTTRGRRHLEILADLQREGARTLLLYVVQRADCDRVEPAEDIDPDYAEALRQAAGRGVEIRAVRARVLAQRILLEKALPVLL